MISSIQKYIISSFNHLVIHAKKLNPLTSRIKEYVIGKFEDISCCFKHAFFLGNNRFNSSNQTSTTQNNNRNVHQLAPATLNPNSSPQPQSPTDLVSNPAEESEGNQLPTTNLGSNSSESVNPFVNNQPLTLDRLNVNQVTISALDLNSPPQPQSPTDLVSNLSEESGVNQPITLSTAVSNPSESVNPLVNNQPLTLDRLNEDLEVWKNDPTVTGNKLEASQRIIQAFQNKSINLDLSRLKLNNLPNIIGQLIQLQTLDLSFNRQLQELPVEIGHLTQLKLLNLSGNSLQALPAAIGHLTQLQELDLAFNRRLQELPIEIGHLTQLKLLNLSGNSLQALPAAIGHLTQLKLLNLENNVLQALTPEVGKLTQLKLLNLSGNSLQVLPAEIGHLTQLEKLYLKTNQLQALPAEIGSLTQLKLLNLSGNSLQVLPAEIGHLTQLEKLYLKTNQLQALPAEIGSLTQLKELYLLNNQLQALPAEIGNLTQLQILNFSSNKLQEFPAQIGHLTQLQELDLAFNKLQALPAEIGQLTQLKELYLLCNQNLTELPLSLGELSEISLIDIDGTQISPEVRQSILAQCQAKRRGQDAFIPRLQKWLTLADVKDVKLKPDVFAAWDERHQDTTKEWLFRLEKGDFQGNQKKLAQIVCNMLHSVAEDKEFKDLFMNQAEVNNTACQDRSAMGLNELYTAWKIYLMEKDQTSSLQDKVRLSIQAAKTLALRGCLTDLINKQEKQNQHIENESVEIFLYYETALKNELNLLSVIERMSYSSIGKRDWIDVNQLKKEVNDQYITHLLDIPAFISTARQDQSFIEQIDLIDAESHKKTEELGSCPVGDEYSEEVLGWKFKNGEINEQHKQSLILMVKKWLEDQRLS